jgi:hypothetical protein
MYWTGDRAGRKAVQDALVKTKYAVAITHLRPNAYMELHTKHRNTILIRVYVATVTEKTVPIIRSGQT